MSNLKQRSYLFLHYSFVSALKYAFNIFIAVDHIDVMNCAFTFSALWLCLALLPSAYMPDYDGRRGPSKDDHLGAQRLLHSGKRIFSFRRPRHQHPRINGHLRRSDLARGKAPISAHVFRKTLSAHGCKRETERRFVLQAIALCQFLENNQQQMCLMDKAVLEIGAGTGLLSIVASLLGKTF